GVEDVSLLGAHYGITGAAAVNPYGYLDVGPTVDGTPNGRPLPDQQIDFEDLLVFAGSYRVAVGPPASAIQLAALGRPVGPAGRAMVGEGDVARVRFRVLKRGLADIRLDAVDARDTANRRLTTDLSVTSQATAPGQTVLYAPAPNPALGGSAIAFTLARPGP